MANTDADGSESAPPSEDEAIPDDGSTSSGSSLPSFSEFAPDWLTSVSPFAKDFLENPQSTLTRSIAAFLLGGVVDITIGLWSLVTTALNAVLGRGAATGLLDIPRLVFSPIQSALVAAFSAAIEGVRGLDRALAAATAGLGPWAPVVTVAVWALLSLVILVVLSRIVRTVIALVNPT